VNLNFGSLPAVSFPIDDACQGCPPPLGGIAIDRRFPNSRRMHRPEREASFCYRLYALVTGTVLDARTFGCVGRFPEEIFAWGSRIFQFPPSRLAAAFQTTT